MKNLGGEMNNLNGNIEDTITNPNKNDPKTGKDTKMEKNTIIDKDNTLMKPEDMDGLQMLRLIQEDNKTLHRKDIVPRLEDSIDQQILQEDPNIISSTEGDEFKHEIKCYHAAKPVVKVASHVSQDNNILEDPKPPKKEDDINRSLLNSQSKKTEKYKEVEGTCIERKPTLIRKEVNDLHGLTERQQKILQDFHVKFVLERIDAEEDDESRASRHLEFVELKKRLEEEEKMYAGCALGEASDVDQNDGNANTIIPRYLTTTHVSAEDKNSLDPAHIAVRTTLDGVINNFAEVAICRQDSNLQGVIKPLLQSQNVRYAMKGLTNDDRSSELQEYTNREGSTGCQFYCQKAGKQIDEGDENDVYMTNTSYLGLNIVCPVSGVPVVELDNPVRSEECEHIYDRTSVLNYIASMAKDGFCLCASPGCHALLAENKLVADNRLWQDIEELRQIKATMWESCMLQDFVNIDDSDDD